MLENTNLSNYLFYLAYVNKKLSDFFKSQSPYIFCKKGCAKCCQNGEYPFSKAEFNYIMIGFSKLSLDIQQQIKNKVKKIQSEKIGKENYTYECPFLFNNECSVYDYRGIICRSFGLMSINEKGKSKIPFCAYEGLNYSNVLDTQTGIISSEKFAEMKTDKEPLAYNVSYKFLTSENIEKNFQINFGDKKALVDWFEF